MVSKTFSAIVCGLALSFTIVSCVLQNFILFSVPKNISFEDGSQAIISVPQNVSSKTTDGSGTNEKGLLIIFEELSLDLVPFNGTLPGNHRPSRSAVGLRVLCDIRHTSWQWQQVICSYVTLKWDAAVGHMRVKLQERYFAAVQQGSALLAAWTGSIASVFSVALQIKSLSNQNCGSAIMESGNYFVSIRTHLTRGGCQTKASREQIENTLRQCVEKAARESMVGYCCEMSNQGRWRASVKVKRKDVPFSFDEISCPGL